MIDLMEIGSWFHKTGAATWKPLLPSVTIWQHGTTSRYKPLQSDLNHLLGWCLYGLKIFNIHI